MAIYVQALDRGGFFAYGAASYDPRVGWVVVSAPDDDEIRAFTFQANSTISAVTAEENGIDATSITISGSKFTTTLTNLASGPSIKFDITMSSGETYTLDVVSQGGAPQRALVSDYGMI